MDTPIINTHPIPKQSKQVDYTQLYYDKEVRVSRPDIANGTPIDLSITVKDFKGIPNCKVEHFGYNFYFRTSAGMNKRKYASTATLERAVSKMLRSKGFTLLYFVSKTEN